MWWTKTSLTFKEFLTIISETDCVLNLSLCVATDLKTCITKNHSFISSNLGTGYKSVIYNWKYFLSFFWWTHLWHVLCWTSCAKHLTKPDILRAHANLCWLAVKTGTNIGSIGEGSSLEVSRTPYTKCLIHWEIRLNNCKPKTTHTNPRCT